MLKYSIWRRIIYKKIVIAHLLSENDFAWKLFCANIVFGFIFHKELVRE